jgi:hypothetical protein
MDFVVIDDSKQKNPSRDGMKSLVGVGGLHIPSDSVRPMIEDLDTLCTEYKFPSYEHEFKWSPDRRSWMRRNLQGEDREAFFIDCLEIAREYEAQAYVVIEDKKHKNTAGKRGDHELDAVKVFLERTDQLLRETGTEAVVLADHPSGGRGAESRFVASCLETLRNGTPFVTFERISMVLTEDSKHTRLLQLADLIVGCTMAFVSGEAQYAPPLFEKCVKPLLRSEGGRIGGVGLKLHADFVYANLYHWLLGDTHFWKNGVGTPMPLKGWQYVNSADDSSPIRKTPELLGSA